MGAERQNLGPEAGVVAAQRTDAYIIIGIGQQVAESTAGAGNDGAGRGGAGEFLVLRELHLEAGCRSGPRQLGLVGTHTVDGQAERPTAAGKHGNLHIVKKHMVVMRTDIKIWGAEGDTATVAGVVLQGNEVVLHRACGFGRKVNLA